MTTGHQTHWNRLRLEESINASGRLVVKWFCRRCGSRQPIAYNYCHWCSQTGIYPESKPFSKEEWTNERTDLQSRMA